VYYLGISQLHDGGGDSGVLLVEVGARVLLAPLATQPHPGVMVLTPVAVLQILLHLKLRTNGKKVSNSNTTKSNVLMQNKQVKKMKPFFSPMVLLEGNE
jgi:hypothetical protein